ncbi:DUF6879 family protein [Streptomyces sp. NPDC059009]|uniref:DUF6879 family protein n=1 Tax=Streptomyces sp. NPDC059009 TaxID=3346694 RepID=UPI00368BE3F2
MARRLRFNGTGSGDDGCPSVHVDLDSHEVIVHGPALTDPEDIGQLRHLGDGEVAIVVPPELLIDFAPKEVNRVPKLIDLDAFAKLFTTFEHTAWRLEMRRRYASDEAADTYREFMATGHASWDLDSPWCRHRRELASQGKRVERVRVVDNPPSIGQLYLLDNARRNSTVGEDIRSLARTDVERLSLPEEDFWIFDSRLVALLNFDAEDTLLDVELITEPVKVNQYLQARDAAMHHAIPYEQFAARMTAEE